MAAIPLITADDWWGKCSKIDVLGARMSYYDSDPKQARTGHTVVFVHGNFTSSYIWRNVVPRVESVARCLAPDLMGHGRSNKLTSDSYRFVDHYRYFAAWMDSMNLPEKVSFVGHDWGAAISFHWCNEHRDRVHSITHIESCQVSPLAEWRYIGEEYVQLWQTLRTDAGEQIVLEQNFVMENLLWQVTMRELAKEEMDAYKEPFLTPGESRRPQLTWARDLPVLGEDLAPDVIAIAAAYYQWLKDAASVPKLFINVVPGNVSKYVVERTKDWVNQKTVDVKGLFMVQELSPFEVADHINTFLLNL